LKRNVKKDLLKWSKGGAFEQAEIDTKAVAKAKASRS